MSSISSICKDNVDSLAIGRFDGIHLGHIQLFNELSPNGAVLIIDTGRSNLTPIKYLPQIIKVPFFSYKLSTIRHLDAIQFSILLKNDFTNLEKIIVGVDFRFGFNRLYCADDLQKLFKSCCVVDEYKIDGIPVHSRYIRSLLLDGNIRTANRFLGRNYTIFGHEVRGQGIGASHLYPTINMICNDFFLPSEGVYATKLLMSGMSYNAVTFLGHRVTTDGNFSIESHILDKNFHLNNAEIAIEFVDKIRNNFYFDKLDELKKQIKNDIEFAKNILST